MEESKKILRLRQVCEMVGLARSSIYALIAANKFPQPLQLGLRARGWREAEVITWINGRARGTGEGVQG